MYKKNLLTLLVLASLAGCSADQPANDPSTAAPEPAAVEATDAPASTEAAAPTGVENAQAARQFEELFPSVVFGTRMHVVENRIYTTDAGERRQGFTLEFLESDAQRVFADVRDGFVAAGYTPGTAAPADADGVLKQNFTLAGKPSPFVAVYPTPGGKPMNEAAAGRVWISWPLEAADAAE